MLDSEHEETTTHRKFGDYRPNHKATIPSSSVQCVHHNSTLHIQSSRDTDISIVMTHGFKIEHYLRDIYRWHRQLPAPSKLTFVTMRAKNLSSFFYLP